jgi:uncharacterized protein involved in outer membrane biogenesis
MILKEHQQQKRWNKLFIRFLIAGLVLVVLVILCISPIVKFMVQKYDHKYLGREVTIDWVYINPFTGYIHLDALKIYEAKNDSVFFEAEGLSINFEIIKLFSKTYEISSLHLDNPRGIIIKHKNIFNFNDLIVRFSEKDSIKTKNEKEPFHFNILNCKISNGEFYFSEPNTPIHYSFIKVNFTTDGKYWNGDTLNGNLSLESGVGSGTVQANFLINTKTLDYTLGAVVTDFNLDVMNQYLKDIERYGSIRGFINANIKATGNLKSIQNIDGSGRIAINDFHYGKDSINDYVSYKKLTIGIIQLAPTRKKYLFDTVRLQEPYFKYEKYDQLDNLQNMFVEKRIEFREVRDLIY